MKIAILGGTGAMGLGLARHLSRSNEVRIGSRDPTRARAAASRIPGVGGCANLVAAKWCDVAVVAMPFGAVEGLKDYAGALSGKLVLSMVNPLKPQGGLFRYASEGRAAAQMMADALPESTVATAFNNVPASFLRKPRSEADVLVAADTREGFERAAEVVRGVAGLRPLYVGPLSEAETIERLTVIFLNAAKLNGGSGLSLKLVS